MAVIKHSEEKKNLGEERTDSSSRLRGDVMAGTQVETIDRCCLLAPALAYAQLLSYIAQAQLPRDSAAPPPHPLAGPSQTKYQSRHSLKDMATVRSG